eukprot:3907240-Alexandrium_andersonii.AAC.1
MVSEKTGGTRESPGGARPSRSQQAACSPSATEQPGAHTTSDHQPKEKIHGGKGRQRVPLQPRKPSMTTS